MSRSDRPVLTRTPWLFLCALISCALWGSAIPAIKLSYRLFSIDTSSPGSLLLFAGVRFTLAGVLVLLWGSLTERRLLLPDRRDWGRVLLVGAFQTVLQYLFYYAALTRASGVTAAILSGTNSFFSILLSTLVFRMEKLTWRKALGCLVGFGGVVLAQLDGPTRLTFSWDSEGLMLLSALSAAVAAVLIGRFSDRTSPVTLSGWQFGLGGLVLIGAGRALGGTLWVISPASVGTVFYLALVSALAYTLWGCLLKYNPVSRVTVFGFLTPIFGVAFSTLALGESALDFRCATALALVCLGIYIVNRTPKPAL